MRIRRAVLGSRALDYLSFGDSGLQEGGNSNFVPLKARNLNLSTTQTEPNHKDTKAQSFFLLTLCVLEPLW